MNPEVKTKWVEALRSDKYEQGFGVLRTKTDKFCCLGVLCDLYSQEHPEVQFKENGTGMSYFFMDRMNVLPDEVVSWAGLANPAGAEVTINGVKDELWIHNDGCNMRNTNRPPRSATFKEIADAIEEQL